GTSSRSDRRGPENIHRVQHTLRRLFMLEVGEDIASGGEMLLNARDHRLALFGRIRGFAVAVVGVVGSNYVGSVAIFGFGHTERDVPFAQRVPGGFDEPGFVAELERGAHATRQVFQKLRKYSLIRFEIRGQLK